MTSSNTASPARYQPHRPLSAAQTVLWLMAGVAAMFLFVSAIFIVKLSLEGRPPFGGATRRTVEVPASPTPGKPPAPSVAPIAQPTPANGGFVSGTENILPPEVAHLARSGNASPVPPAATAPSPPIVAAPIDNTQATARPAPAPAPAPPPAAAPTPTVPPATDAIAATLRAWIAAWERKDIPAYLEHYADDFTPAQALSRADWLEQRRQRLSRPGALAIRIDGLDITTRGDRATARFAQSYRAGSLNLNETKTIELTLRNGAWKILEERLGR